MYSWNAKRDPDTELNYLKQARANLAACFTEDNSDLALSFSFPLNEFLVIKSDEEAKSDRS